jgi:hypothetical protein
MVIVTEGLPPIAMRRLIEESAGHENCICLVEGGLRVGSSKLGSEVV